VFDVPFFFFGTRPQHITVFSIDFLVGGAQDASLKKKEGGRGVGDLYARYLIFVACVSSCWASLGFAHWLQDCGFFWHRVWVWSGLVATSELSNVICDIFSADGRRIVVFCTRFLVCADAASQSWSQYWAFLW
jgi:hypothetical protein